jgi:tight adherence protein C
MLPVIIAIVLFFVCLVALFLGLTTSSRQQRISERIEELSASRPVVEQVQSSVTRQLEKPFTERIIKPAYEAVNKKLLSIAPSGMIESTRQQLNAAGNPPGLTEPLFLLARGMSMLVGAGLGMYLYTHLLATAAPMVQMAISLFVLFAFSMLPDYLLQGKIKTRQTLIRKALPDTLDLLVVSAEAGMGLDSALAEVIQRKEGPLADEFDRALLEVRLGKRRREAWQDMADRVQVDELSALVAALYQAEELGVSISRALRTHSDQLRAHRSLRIREQAAVLGTKMLFPLIFCIFPALFVIVLGPGMMTMKDVFSAMGGK